MRAGDGALLAALRRHLGQEEQVAWHGRPGTVRAGVELAALLALILAGGLAAKCLHAAGGPGEAASDFVELAVPCFIAGIVFWVYRFKRWCNLHFTIYGITNTHLLIVQSRRPAPVAKVQMPKPLVERHRRFRSRATIRVTTRLHWVDAQGDTNGGWLHDFVDLVDVRDADRAFALLRGN